MSKQASGSAAAAAAAAVTLKQEQEQRARMAEWIRAYRRAFPSFVFYFEGIDESTIKRLSVPIRSLGGKVEPFFSAQTVTHVIVEHAGMAPGGANTKSSAAGVSSSSHVVSLAERFHLKIWDLDKFENRVLAVLIPGCQDHPNNNNNTKPGGGNGTAMLSAKRKLDEAFSTEKMYAMRQKAFEGASASHCVDFYYLKYFYVLVEDASHLNRPALVEDFRPPELGCDPPWPKLYMVPTGRCPFIQYDDPTTSSKGSETDPDYNKENITPDPSEPTTLPAPQILCKTPGSRCNTQELLSHMKPPPLPRHYQQIARPTLTRENAEEDNQILTPTRPSRRIVPNNLLVASNAGSTVMDSNASGINHSLGVTSTSTAFGHHSQTVDPVLQKNLLQNLNGGRVTQLTKMQQPVATAGISNIPRIAGQAQQKKAALTAAVAAAAAASRKICLDEDPQNRRASGHVPPISRTRKLTAPIRRPVVARPGYCENCRVKYDDMMEHVKTTQHRRFATNERNWVELDALLETVKRPPNKRRAMENSDDHPVLSLYSAAKEGKVSKAPATGVTESAPASMMGGEHAAASGGIIPTRRPIPVYPSPHMLASGRLSTETTTPAQPTTARDTIQLAYSNSSNEGEDSNDVDEEGEPVAVNDTPVTPLPRRLTTSIATSASLRGIETLVSPLETPRFNRTQPYEDPEATLVAGDLPYRRQSLDGAQYNETPTRVKNPGSGRNLLEEAGGETLVQPSRVKTMFKERTVVEETSDDTPLLAGL